MKFETTAHILTSSLRQFVPVIERRNTVPILSTILFDGREIKGTDLDLELTIAVPATKAEGKIAIDFRSLLNLVRLIPSDDSVLIEGGREGATVSFSSGRYDLPSLPASDFPDWISGSLKRAQVDGAKLQRALSFATPFISTEETRYYLNGVCLDGDAAVATDGHRLGCVPTGSDFGSFDRPIIPAKVVRLLTSLPAPKAISIATDRPGISIVTDGARLSAKLIDGKFPDWRRVVPKFSDSASRITVDRRQLIAAASRAMVARTCETWPCGTLAWANGRVALAATRKGGGSAREYLDKAIATGEGHASFNLRYIIDLLTAFRADHVTAEIADPDSPVMVSAKGDAFAIIMPIRGGDEEFARQALADWETVNEPRRVAA